VAHCSGIGSSAHWSRQGMSPAYRVHSWRDRRILTHGHALTSKQTTDYTQRGCVRRCEVLSDEIKPGRLRRTDIKETWTRPSSRLFAPSKERMQVWISNTLKR